MKSHTYVGHVSQVIIHTSSGIKAKHLTTTYGTIATAMPTDLFILRWRLITRGGKLDLDILEDAGSAVGFVLDVGDHWFQISENYQLVLVKLGEDDTKVFMLEVERVRPQRLHHPSLENGDL